MNHLDTVAFAELGALVPRARYDFVIAFHGHEGLCKAKGDEKLPHGRAWLDLPFFTVDQESHRP